jgi:hypothetical protein
MKKACWLALSAALLAGHAPGGVLSLRPGDLEIVADESQRPLAVSELQNLLGEAFGSAIPVVLRKHQEQRRFSCPAWTISSGTGLLR